MTILKNLKFTALHQAGLGSAVAAFLPSPSGNPVRHLVQRVLILDARRKHAFDAAVVLK
jgi:hypothetical protein